MKKKNMSKKALAVLLSVIMIATSIPFAIIGTAAGTYDPAPYFDAAAQTEGARAWVDDEGNVQVTFPSATAQPTYKGEALSIAFYILELVDMGANDAAHTDVVLDTIKVTGTSGTFAAADIGELDLENKRYSVTVTAVDTENWFSLPIYTTVTDVPVAKIDASRFANFSTSATAVREMATFDGETNSDNTATTSGNALMYMGTAEEAGTEDLSDNVGDTAALRFIMNIQPSGTQTFYTSYSRETWDFKGAEEVWYWLDFSKVDIQGMAFSLGAQCKTVTGWADGKNVDVAEGEVVHYSTKGTVNNTYAEGEEPYVWVQREDGGWNKVMMNNGTIDIANFKGYVRVPLKYFCSTEDRYITVTNVGFGTDKSDIVASDWRAWADTGELTAETQANGDAYVATLKSSSQILADPAGTPVSEALMLQYRVFKSSAYKRAAVAGGTCTWDLGYMPAAAVGADGDDGLYTAASDSKRATVNLSAGTVTRNADTYRAIEDLKTMGFSFEGATADSLQNSFFVDNIFFYRADGGAYSENSLNGVANTGSPMTTYYSEENTIAKIIFDEIDKYISDPDWADYRELEYILELIEEYKAMYTAQGKEATFLNLTRSPETTGLAGMAAKLNCAEIWEKAWLAYEACAAEGTIDTTQANVKDWFISNAGKKELVPLIVRTMEKLPAPESIASVSDELRAEIVKLWQAYSLLNLGQLEMLGSAEEEKLLKYFLLVEDLASTDGDEFIVGQQLADYPYIIYNDFESNCEVGDKGWQLEDNKDAYTTGFTSVNGTVAGTSNLANDWRHLKGLVTYTYNGEWDAPGTEGVLNITDKDMLGYVTTDSNKDHEAMDGKAHYAASHVTITNNGYMHSNAATMEIDSSFTADNHEGAFHTISITRQGKSYSSYTEGEANNMSLDGLGNLSTEYVSGDTSIGLSLIFYVDFTELESFYFTTNVFTKKEDGSYVKARVNMGTALTEQTKINDWKYFILSPETGEWVINHTTSQWCFTSTKTDESWGDTLSLDGYKGYIMIPLYHIKVFESVTRDAKLDGNATWLNNIYAIQFCIGGANGNSLDEKSFTIDNVGFTYDPAGYPNVSNTSYADKFKAKSLPAKAFEDKVAEIDLYDDFATFKAKVDEANAMYEALPGYQKTATAQAKMLLGEYTVYAKGYETVPEEIISPEDLSTYAQSLPAELTGSSVTGTSDIPHPGFTGGEVNYSTLGIDRATAEQIIQYYNEGYSRFSTTQKENMANRAEFLAAYNMSMRLSQTLEGIKTEAGSYGSAASGTTGSGFLGELSTSLYTRKYDDEGNFVGNFVSIAGRDTVLTFKEDKYDILQYYTKTTMDDGTYNTNVKNISRGFTYFLNNTQSYSIDGETIEGGIITFQKKMQEIYDMANDHITNKTLFTDDELQSVKDIIEEYDALLPAYNNVEELYDLKQAILGLFPTAATEALDVTEVLLTEDKLTGDASTYKVTYSEILDYDESGDYYFVRVTSANGALTNDYGNSVAYDIAINSDTKTSDAIVAASPYTATVTNNAYTPASPMSYVITPSLSAKPTGLSGTVRDTLTVELVLMEDGAETVIETQSIEVSYSMGDAYTVTIPAEFPVSWEDSSAQDVSYLVTTEMEATSKLTVGVTNDGTGTLTNTVTADVLTYTAENFVETEFGNREIDAKPDPAPTVTVSGWEDVPVGEYRTTLTYTVVYDDGSDDSTT